MLIYILILNIIMISSIGGIIFLFVKWKLGLMEFLELLYKKKLTDHVKKCKLKPGELVLLKTKAGYYPIKVKFNTPETKSIDVETDSFLTWKEWYYQDFELIDTETKKILYGG